MVAGVSAGVTQYTGNGKTGDISLPVLGVTLWEFIRELLSITLETILNHIGTTLLINLQLETIGKGNRRNLRKYGNVEFGSKLA